jgi:uncharacterized membrane protein YkvA (DUF1232 family)
MTTLENRCLDAFPTWLRSLADDANALAGLLENPEIAEPAKRRVAGALTYLFKSLDLIPDGLEDLGFIDDSFVFRVAARAASAEASSEVLAKLAEEAALIEEFLGDAYPRLSSYVEGLGTSSARGRSVDDVLSDESRRDELVREVRQWAAGYEAPAFGRDEKNLVKLRSFLLTKLPA